MSNRRQGYSEVQYPIAQKQSYRVACLPDMWKTLVLDPQHRRGNRNKAHYRLFSVRNTTHRFQGLSTRAQAS